MSTISCPFPRTALLHPIQPEDNPSLLFAAFPHPLLLPDRGQPQAASDFKVAISRRRQDDHLPQSGRDSGQRRDVHLVSHQDEISRERGFAGEYPDLACLLRLPASVIEERVQRSPRLRGPELRALRKLFREYPDSPYVFAAERKGPLTSAAVRKIVGRAGELADLEFPVHPHMLRHATGYYLAPKGQDTRAIQAYMGHKNIQHTVRYMELSPERFKDFWKD